MGHPFWWAEGSEGRRSANPCHQMRGMGHPVGGGCRTILLRIESSSRKREGDADG